MTQSRKHRGYLSITFLTLCQWLDIPILGTHN